MLAPSILFGLRLVKDESLTKHTQFKRPPFVPPFHSEGMISLLGSGIARLGN